MIIDTYRRVYGLSLGAALGLAFALTSQVLNSLAVPNVIFHQPPLGMIGNVVICVLAGGLMGLISSWLTSSFISVLIAAVIGSIVVELAGTFYETYLPPSEVGTVLFTLVILLLPMTGLFGAVFGLLRWIVNKQVDLHRDHASLLRRMLLPVTAVLIMGAVGTISFYPAEGQQRIKEMNDLVQAGLRSTDTATWPPALRHDAEAFKQRATPQYTLQWIKGDAMPRWRIGQPAGFQSWQYSIVAARFDTGWILACLFMPDNSAPRCQAYDRDPSVNHSKESDQPSS